MRLSKERFHVIFFYGRTGTGKQSTSTDHSIVRIRIRTFAVRPEYPRFYYRIGPFTGSHTWLFQILVVECGFFGMTFPDFSQN
jgi:hypothetical protein